MDYFHKLSRSIINTCIENNIKEIVIGYNISWKNGVNMGRKNNDKFYKIPYRKLINLLFYKAKMSGIVISEHEESYTSKCDALAFEHIGFNEVYSGRRIKRGLFSSQTNTPDRVLVHGDVNGTINIIRKKLKDNQELLEKLKRIINVRKLVCNPKVVNVYTRKQS